MGNFLHSTASDSSSSKFLRFSIIVSSICLGIVLRLGNFGFFTADLTGHFNFIDTDCYYQLRRLVYFLSNFPKTLTFDPLADWPTGSMVDWPDGFIYIIGVPLKIFGVHDFKSLEIGACMVMIVLGLLTCWFIYLLAKRLLQNSSLALLVFFVTCINFLLIRFSCLGELDHHILEAMFPSLVLLLSFKAFEDRKTWAAVALGLSISLFLWVSSSSIFMIGVFFALYAFLFSKREAERLYFIVVATFCVSLLPLCFYHYFSFGSFKLLTHPSFFHLFLILSLAALAFFISRYKQKSIKLLTAFFLVSVFLYWIQFPTILMEPLHWAIDYVFGKAGVLQNVSEASPIFMSFEDFNLNFMYLNFGYFIYLLPLVWILSFFIKKRPLEDQVLILSLSLLSIPGIFQKRFCHIMVGIFLVYLVWCLKQIHAFLKKHHFKIGPAFSLLFLGCLVFPGFKYGFFPEGSPRDRIDHGITHFLVENKDVATDLAWDRLALKHPVSEGIFANPNMGHLLQYVTGLGVITNPFYHSKGFDLDFKIRQAKTDAEFRYVLKENKIRYMIFVDDFKFLEMQYRLRRLSTAEIIENKIVNDRYVTIFQMQELMKYAWVRWLMSENEPENFKQLFRANFLEDYFYKNSVAYRFDDF